MKQITFSKTNPIRTRLLVLLLFVFGPALLAQTAETAVFRAVMLPSSEVPPANVVARGTADVFASVVRDSSGQIVSGTVDVLARVTFPGAVSAMGLDLWAGSAGQKGTVALSTGLTTTNTRTVQLGGDLIHIPIQVAGDDPSALTVLRSLVQDPTQFYINLLTNTFPNGAIRGQLQRAQVMVLMALISSDQVVTRPNAAANGVAQVVAIATRDSTGNLTSGEVYVALSYASGDRSGFTGFQIRPGRPGSTGSAGIPAALPPGLAPDPTGVGAAGPFYTEITVTTGAQAGAFANLFVNPTSLYVEVDTAANPAGILRGQLRTTDAMVFPVMMSSTSEVTTPSTVAAAPARFTLYTLRNEDGTVAGGTMLADIDYRFPGPQQFIGAYVHDAAPGQEGPISIEIAGNFSSDTGLGNYYGWSLPIANTAALNDIVSNPENHCVNLHSVSDPAGAVRAQMMPAVTRPAVAAAISANLDKNATPEVVPGGLISIFGTNLAKVSADLSGWTGSRLPVSLNGVSVSIGGQLAPLIYVSPGQINAQAPLEIPAGRSQALFVDNGNGPGTAVFVNVGSAAPAIFFYPVPAVLRNRDFSLITAGNPAHAGDVLLVYATGLGQTTPPLATGVLVPSGVLSNTAAITATISGKAAAVLYSIASPGFAGLYQVAVTVPAGATGTVPLAIQEGSAVSNAVSIAVQ